jgi:hypothetical protein
MKTAIRLVLIGLFIAAVITSESHGANFNVPANDGWYTWQVDAADGGELQVYALIESGSPSKFRVRGDSVCYRNFKFNVEATDLGRVEADESIAWLQGFIRPAGDLSSDAIIAISLHAGDLPFEIIDRILSTNT